MEEMQEAEDSRPFHPIFSGGLREREQLYYKEVENVALERKVVYVMVK